MRDAESRGPGAARAGLVLGLLLAAAAPVRGHEGETHLVYEYETALAPVCIDGTFPLDLLVQGAWIRGTLAGTTDAKGRVAGTWTVTATNRVLEATGKVKFLTGVADVELTLRDAGTRVRLKGAGGSHRVVSISPGSRRGRATSRPGPATSSSRPTAPGPRWPRSR